MEKKKIGGPKKKRTLPNSAHIGLIKKRKNGGGKKKTHHLQKGSTIQGQEKKQ